MAIDFPASPSVSDTFTVGSVTYTWDGTKWTAVAASGAADKIIEGNTSAEVIDTGSDGRFVVTTEGSERARVDSSGRLLVGTSTSPTGGDAQYSKLVVKGYVGDNTGYAPIALMAGTNGASLASGAGIGRIEFCAADSASFAQITASVDGTTGSNDYPGRLVFSTTADGASSPTERLRIGNDGGSALYSQNTSSTLLNLQTAASAGTSAAIITGTYGATGVLTGTASIRVWSNGNIQNTNNSYTAISDIKLKENIVDANSQWDDLKAFRVRNYNLKEGQTHTQIGLVAQEVEPISPGLVYESPDRDDEGNDLGTVTKSVNYSVLYMKAVKALQEAMERIETLEAKVAALESV